MNCPTRNLPDHALEAVIDAHFPAPPAPKPRRCDSCSDVATHCAAMLEAYVNEHFGGYLLREHAAGLRELADAMARMGDRP